MKFCRGRCVMEMDAGEVVCCAPVRRQVMMATNDVVARSVAEYQGFNADHNKAGVTAECGMKNQRAILTHRCGRESQTATRAEELAEYVLAMGQAPWSDGLCEKQGVQLAEERVRLADGERQRLARCVVVKRAAKPPANLVSY